MVLLLMILLQWFRCSEETKHVTSSDYTATHMPRAISLFMTSSASYWTHLTRGRGGDVEHAKWFSELLGTYYS
jgi:hypothetical protein